MGVVPHNLTFTDFSYPFVPFPTYELCIIFPKRAFLEEGAQRSRRNSKNGYVWDFRKGYINEIPQPL